MSPHHFAYGSIETVFPVPSIVNSNSFNDTAASPAHALGFTAAIGNRLIAFVAIRDTSNPVLSSITQTNVTWVRVSSSFEAGVNDHACEMWISDEITSTPGTTSTFNYANLNTNTAIVVEVNNLFSTPHGTVSTSGTSSGETSLVGIGTESDNDLPRALTLNYFLQRRDNTPTLTPNNSFALVERVGTGGGNTSNSTVALYESLNDTRGTLFTTVTSSESERWATICFTLNGLGGPHGYR